MKKAARKIPQLKSGAATKKTVRIESEADIKAAVKALRRKCAFMRAAHDFAGDPPLRRRAGGFEGLVRIVNGQQLSVASAAAIHALAASTWFCVDTGLN